MVVQADGVIWSFLTPKANPTRNVDLFALRNVDLFAGFVRVIFEYLKSLDKNTNNSIAASGHAKDGGWLTGGVA